jgi:hypothetical protein
MPFALAELSGLATRADHGTAGEQPPQPHLYGSDLGGIAPSDYPKFEFLRRVIASARIPRGVNRALGNPARCHGIPSRYPAYRRAWQAPGKQNHDNASACEKSREISIDGNQRDYEHRNKGRKSQEICGRQIYNLKGTLTMRRPAMPRTAVTHLSCRSFARSTVRLQCSPAISI